MKFFIKKEKIIKPLQQVNNSISTKPILPILNNLLLTVKEQKLSLTGSDLEIELTVNIKLEKNFNHGSITVPAKKLFDICRGLPNKSKIKFFLKNKFLIIKSNKINFLLSTLPSDNFPKNKNLKNKTEFYISQNILKSLLESTQFSMANQDVRYYLNGMLFEIDKNKIKSIATDGHRLAFNSIKIDQNLSKQSIIIPRKGIIELIKILEKKNNLLKIGIGNNNIHVYFKNITFTSKLIHARFPNYKQVLPKTSNKILKVDHKKLKEALLRSTILSNEKFHGIRLYLQNNQLKITANNQEQEESTEKINVEYNNEIMEIGCNVNYILDVLNTLQCKKVHLLLNNSHSSIKIKDEEKNNSFYIIMPMRL